MVELHAVSTIVGPPICRWLDPLSSHPSGSSSSTCWGSPDAARCGQSVSEEATEGGSRASPARCVLGTEGGGSPCMCPHFPN